MNRFRHPGFTTIELVISLTLLGIFIPLAAAGVNMLTVTNNRARDLALVNMLANNKAEVLRSAGYNSIEIETVDFSDELPSILSSPKSASYTVTSPSDGIKDVSITINYTSYKQSKTVNYKTKISELGVAQ